MCCLQKMGAGATSVLGKSHRDRGEAAWYVVQYLFWVGFRLRGHLLHLWAKGWDGGGVTFTRYLPAWLG